jgi:hypothetical protein
MSDESEYVFNNEAIGLIAISSVLKYCKQLSYGQTMLILPFLLHEETRKYLKRSNSVKRSIEEVVVKRIKDFGTFNARFRSLLPVAINSILILKEMGAVEIDTNCIRYREGRIDFDDKSLGKRAISVIQSSEVLSRILVSEEVSSVYLKLRVQL